MWLLFGICIMIVTTECADTSGFENGIHFATNWRRYEASKPPDIFKLPRKILFVPTSYHTNTQQWNKNQPIGSNQSGRELATTNKEIGNSEPKYQMMQLRSSGSTLPEWLFTRNPDNEKERRNPSFNPWGGKRDSSQYQADPRIRRPSRVPFNSWGGKRNHDSINNDNKNDENAEQFHTVNLSEIKKPFNSWGGKRTPIVIEYLVNLSSKDVLKHIWPSTHSPLTFTSINQHMKPNSPTDNDEVSNMDDEKMRITFEPWNGEKINVNTNDNDISSSASTLHYTQ